MEGELCEHCTAVRPRWIGAAHVCMPPPSVYHPYSYFLDPIDLDD